MFEPLPRFPDHPALEEEILAWWERRRIFDRLREQNADGPRWSFIDGPVTANKTLAVHTAWGRTLKDVFQRYKALRGFHQRYQNGFDCQGLWIEVGVEKSLGLNSKQEIEQYGLEEFARRCREVVVWSSEELTRGSQRLGMWMDWGNDYFTFSDTNIEYIWRFLKVVHERGWLYRGHRASEWCPRCGTSLSQHELSQSGVYQDRADPSLFVRLPLIERPGQALVIWTTTPWTLPANVAVAVHPAAEYARRPNGEWVAKARYPQETFAEVVHGRELVGLRYEGPFDTLAPGGSVEHRVIPWEEVSLEEGTGVVHIAPGCGPEDFELSKEQGLAVLAPIDEAGRFFAQYGWLAGEDAGDPTTAVSISEDLRERGLLAADDVITHRYPHCWRCDTPLLFRLTDDWFIAVDEIRPQLLEANQGISWTPDYFGRRMDDWLRNMGDWNISRRRFFGLPLPFYPCPCGQLNVVGSRDELGQRATAGLEGLEELHRPWIDAVTIRCAACGRTDVRRVPEVGDVWLDAGIVPFSTLGWQSPKRRPGGYATGASQGLSTADLPDHAFWEQWFPADWVCEMREQIRLWFYSLLFMSVTLTGRAPYREVLSYEKLLDAEGREMHGSWGNMIDADEAIRRMGADVMRWLYCAQPPTQNIRFGFGPAEEVKRRLLTLWNSVSFLVGYARIEGFLPRYADLESGPTDADLRPLDRWLLARVWQLQAEVTAGYEASLTARVVQAFETFVDDLSNWYVRRSRRRFYGDDQTAFRTLWTALVQSVRTVAPIMPFLAEHLWRRLVTDVCPEAPESVFLAGWPAAGSSRIDERLLAEIAAVRRVVELGRQARSAHDLKLRQPLRRLVVEGAPAAEAHAHEIADELRVKEVEFGRVEATQLVVRPNLPLLGPRLGRELPRIRAALAEGAFEQLADGRFRVAGHELAAEEVLVERGGRDGWVVAAEDGITVALEIAVDAELALEGRALDLIHTVQRLRREAGLAITDRILVTVPESERDVVESHGEWIRGETLARELEVGGELAVERAGRSGC